MRRATGVLHRTNKILIDKGNFLADFWFYHSFKDDPVAFHCSKSKSQVAAVVSYVFILSYMANPASFLVLVCCKLLYGDNTFYIHLCHVTLECPKPRPL